VGPTYRGGGAGEAELLASCYRNSIQIADQYELKTIAFPSISTGAYGYPIDEASRIALSTVQKAIEMGPTTLERIIFVTFGYWDYRSYQDAYGEIFEPPSFAQRKQAL
jgi:O-acetyl-ADP-ribose deacetylase (regulator of RNase III)